MKILVSFIAGVLFSVGLAVSGMTQPAKVIAFLDFTGAFDFSLGLVMAGGLLVLFVAQALVRRRAAPVLGGQFPEVVSSGIDGRLLAGAALFGIGWGIAGYCPGPAITSFAGGVREALVFLPAMTAGMILFQLVEARSLSSQPTEETFPAPDPG